MALTPQKQIAWCLDRLDYHTVTFVIAYGEQYLVI